MDLKKNIKNLAVMQIFLALLMAVPFGVSLGHGEIRTAHAFMFTMLIMDCHVFSTILIIERNVTVLKKIIRIIYFTAIQEMIKLTI